MVHDQYIYIYTGHHQLILMVRDYQTIELVLFKNLIRILAGISSYLGLLEHSPKIHRTHLLPFGLWSVR
jgi:hypothetical protein